MDVSYLKLHPLDCCVYPYIFKDEEVSAKCREKCESSKVPQCSRICYLTEIGAYVDKKFHPEGIKNLFENGCNDTEKARESTKGPLDDAWKDVLEESIKLCDKEYKHDAEIPEKKIADYVHKYQVCLRMHNFLNCPDMVSSKDCDEVKDLIKTCDKSTHETLFGAFHEPRKHIQKSNDKHGDIGPGAGPPSKTKKEGN